jgi:DNA-directed RNA polymerase subunit E'/Rpb7
MEQPQRREQQKIELPYMSSVLTMKIFLKITEIGESVKKNLEDVIRSRTEGRCISEGYIRPRSIRILSYSSGKINGDLVEYHAVYECMLSHPVEGMKVECVCKMINKAGIHAEVTDYDETTGNTYIPMVVYIARDHHINNSIFEHVKENAKLLVTIVGIRYELNDPHITTIGRLVENKTADDFSKISVGTTNKKPIRIL